MKRMALIAVTFAAALAPSAAHACKYSIRDVGFANADRFHYHLVLFSALPQEAPRQLAFDHAARETFAESNVIVTTLNATRDTDHPLVKRLATMSNGDVSLWFIGPSDIMSRLPFSAKDLDGPLERETLRRLIDSPVRQAMAKHLPTCLATILVIDGDDAQENALALEAAQTAAKQVTQVLGRLEKAPKAGPEVLRITADDREHEQWLLWGLGIDMAKRRAAVAIVFGEFRQAAKMLKGDEINAAAIFSPLAALGFSCECNLDRTALFGPTLPHRWTAADRKNAIAALGFDPEDSQFRADIRTILAKTPRIEPVELRLTFEELQFGIRELSLDEDDPPLPSLPTLPAKEVKAAVPPPSASTGQLAAIVAAALAVSIFVGLMIWRR